MSRSLIALPLLWSMSIAQAHTISDSIKSYGQHVHTTYAETLKRAELLKSAIHLFVENPSIITHEFAKETWKYAREPYGKTEAFRFYNGPIDRDGGPEGLLNSWPLDEAYIDYVAGNPNAGIINNVEEFPEITRELLVSLNELDGEKNISTGYHAIEFLLWGQDFFVEGPGRRIYRDYTDAPNASRRAAYLKIAADLLVDDVAVLEKEWRADETNYRTEFEALDKTLAIKKILSGIIFMAGDELSGERMYVAYESQGQEDEHSCFSDMTHKDILWNFLGVRDIIHSTKILELPEVKDKAIASSIKNRLVSLELSLLNLPTPFDQAIATEEGRAFILSDVEELEALAHDLVEVSKLLNAKVDY